MGPTGWTGKKMALQDTDIVPVVELFHSKTYCEVLDYALDELSHDEWVPTRIIRENVDASRESLRKSLPPLVAYGVLDVKDPDAPIPHYRLAETPVVNRLQQWQSNTSSVDLLNLFAYTGRGRLVEFFLTAADPDESYSLSAIADTGIVGYSSARDYIEDVVTVGLVEAVDGTRGTECQVDTNHPLYDFLTELNNAIHDVYLERA
jgi:hypothetical protein